MPNQSIPLQPAQQCLDLIPLEMSHLTSFSCRQAGGAGPARDGQQLLLLALLFVYGRQLAQQPVQAPAPALGDLLRPDPVAHLHLGGG